MLDLSNVKHIHFIGVGGVSMSKLFAYFVARGYYCTGSDIVSSKTIDALSSLGGKVYIGSDEVIAASADLTVYTSAIRPDNREKSVSINPVERKIMLKYLESKFASTVAVAGAHGKTTVSAMLAWLYHTMGCDAVSQVGGDVVGLDSLQIPPADSTAIFEACEYRRSFLELSPDCGLVLNVDFDHPDCYSDIDDTYAAFGQFVEKIKTLAVLEYNCAARLTALAQTRRDMSSVKIVTFGDSVYADYYVMNEYLTGDGYSFEVYSHGKFLGEYCLSTINKININCALAVVAYADSVGIRVHDVRQALASFRGVERRMQRLGLTANGAVVYTDYAHHPREISVLLSNVRRVVKGRLAVVFQPHTYSRTKALLSEFVSVLSGGGEVYLLPTYPAREQPFEGTDSIELYNEVVKVNPAARYCQYQDLGALLSCLVEGDMILLVGAGIDYQLIFDSLAD